MSLVFVSSSLIVYISLIFCAWHSCKYLFKSTFLAQGFSHLIPINSNGNCMAKSITTHSAKHLPLSNFPFVFPLRYFLACLKFMHGSGYQNFIWVLWSCVPTELKCLNPVLRNFSSSLWGFCFDTTSDWLIKNCRFIEWLGLEETSKIILFQLPCHR